VFGCAFITGKRHFLGVRFVEPAPSPGGNGGITRLRLAGHRVAIVDVSESAFNGRYAAIAIYNLRTGAHANVPANQSDDIDITDLALRPNGSIAFIEGLDGPASHKPPKHQIVRRYDRHGDTILEDSATIDPFSLTLIGRHLTWMSAGLTRTATIS
jgi:hypothetical protein